MAVGWTAPLRVSSFGPLGRRGERWWGASKSVPGVMVGAAKCRQSSGPLLGAKHIVGPWIDERKERRKDRKTEEKWTGEDKHEIHCKLIGHKTILRTCDEKDSTTKAAFVFVSGGSLPELFEREVNGSPHQGEKNLYSFSLGQKGSPSLLNWRNRGDSLALFSLELWKAKRDLSIPQHIYSNHIHFQNSDRFGTQK